MAVQPPAIKNRGGIALRNVNSRIRLMFGEDYGLRVSVQRHRYGVLRHDAAADAGRLT